MQAVAQPGEILIAHESWLLVRDSFACTPQEPIHVKGFERPIQTYIVGGLRGEDGQGGRIEESCDGFSLALDPSLVKPEDRAAIADKLRSALKNLPPA